MVFKLINLRIMFSHGSRHGFHMVLGMDPSFYFQHHLLKRRFPSLNYLHAYIGYYLSTCVLSIYPSVVIYLDLFLHSLICSIDLFVYVYKNESVFITVQ